MLRICALSDLHGTLIPASEFDPCDVMFICGDISPLNIQANDRKMKKWLANTFKPWCEALPCLKVFFIAGNHDWICLRNPDFMKSVFPQEEKVTYLCQDRASFTSEDGTEYSIFGTPYCRQFCNWAFMEEDETLAQLYQTIPNNVDILLTHDQPYGFGDIILQPTYWNTGENLGNKPLLEAVLLRRPKYMFCGHLHASTHECVDIGLTKRYNVSIKDENYDVVYAPSYLEI